MWNGTMFVDLDWPLNASSLLSASAELLVHISDADLGLTRLRIVIRRYFTDAAQPASRPGRDVTVRAGFGLVADPTCHRLCYSVAKVFGCISQISAQTPSTINTTIPDTDAE